MGKCCKGNDCNEMDKKMDSCECGPDCKCCEEEGCVESLDEEFDDISAIIDLISEAKQNMILEKLEKKLEKKYGKKMDGLLDDLLDSIDNISEETDEKKTERFLSIVEEINELF